MPSSADTTVFFFVFFVTYLTPPVFGLTPWQGVPQCLLPGMEYITDVLNKADIL